MKTLSTEHLLTVAVILGLVVAVTWTARSRPGAWTILLGRALAVLLVANEAGWWVWLAFHGSYSLAFALPLQLCDVACFAAAAALWTRHPALVELSYFWGIAGTANGLLTPDLAGHFPDFLYFQYFIAHGAIVLAALLLVVGLRIEPRPGAALRVFGITVALLLVDSVADLVTGGNYLYLRHTPGVHSLLDLFGPWPWYVLGASVVALGVFTLLELPFSIRRRLDRGRPAGPPAAPEPNRAP